MHAMKKNKRKSTTHEDERFTLDGWDHDIDDLGYASNILKLLEKKITCPSLNANHSKPVNRQPLPQKLPTVPEHLKSATMQTRVHNLPALELSRQKIMQPIKSEKKIAPDSEPLKQKTATHYHRKTETSQYSPYEITDIKFSKRETTEPSRSLNSRQFAMSHNRFVKASPRIITKEAMKRSQEVWLAKHNKLRTSQSTKLTPCEPIFMKDPPSYPLEVRRKQEIVRTECYTKPKNLEKKEKVRLKVKKSSTHMDHLTRMIWMEKNLDGNNPKRSQKAYLPEVEDFQDQHMQY